MGTVGSFWLRLGIWFDLTIECDSLPCHFYTLTICWTWFCDVWLKFVIPQSGHMSTIDQGKSGSQKLTFKTAAKKMKHGTVNGAYSSDRPAVIITMVRVTFFGNKVGLFSRFHRQYLQLITNCQTAVKSWALRKRLKCMVLRFDWATPTSIKLSRACSPMSTSDTKSLSGSWQV